MVVATEVVRLEGDLALEFSAAWAAANRYARPKARTSRFIIVEIQDLRQRCGERRDAERRPAAIDVADDVRRR